jgi:hypothetical protein
MEVPVHRSIVISSFVVSLFIACVTTPEPAAQDAASAAEPEASAGVDPAMKRRIAILEQMLEGDADKGVLRYLLALYTLQTDDAGRAIDWLEELAGGGWSQGIPEPEFEALAHDPRFQAVSERLQQAVPLVDRSRKAFQLGDGGTIPEGIAWDPVRGRFLIGSMRQRRIIESSNGAERDFVAPAADGMPAVAGIRVDPLRGEVWAATFVETASIGFSESDRSALYAFDLEGRFLRRLDPPGGNNLMNDLVVGRDGTLYVTDSLAGAVWRVDPASREFEPLLAPGSLHYPNGITFGPDGSRLYVAHLFGIETIDPASGSRSAVRAPESISLGGIDGLYFYDRSLIAVQNGFGEPRVIRFHLESDGAVGRAEVLVSQHPEFRMPTTGALRGDTFYFIANSHLRRKDAEGQYPPGDQLSPPLILAVELNQ